MLNQISAEALYSATFVENYMDCVENLPDDAQRHLSRIRDIDVQVRNYLRDVENYYDQWVKLLTSTNEIEIQKRSKLMAKIQKAYINAQELGDEKMQTVNQLQELIDQKTRQVDLDYKNLDYGKEDHLMDTSPVGIGTGGLSGSSGVANQNNQTVQSIPKTPRANSPVSAQILQTAEVKDESIQRTMKYLEKCAIAQSFTAVSSSNTTTAQRVSTPTISEKAIINTSSNNNVNSNNINNTNNANNNGNGTGNGNNSNIVTEPRTTSKRSRRPRNDTNSVINELAGNESNNSANESGNNRNSTQSVSQSGSKVANSGLNNSGNSSNTGNAKKSGGQGGAGGKKKKRKARGQNNQNQRDEREESPLDPFPIDPDEPTYCLCDQISFGEMILCDNDLCPIEWFHFSCVSLLSKPKGKWFCPNCRGDRPNVMKPKAQFLKELERYNKEKEEKT